MVDLGPLHPWNRQPGETSKAYEAFSLYRDLGSERSTRRVSEQLAKSETLIKRWSGKYDWVARAGAWDSVPAQAVAEAYSDMAQRIAAQHERLATKLANRLERNLDLLPEGADPSIRWSTAQAAAHRSHSFATDLSKPESGVKKEISDQIAALLAKLSE
jgi:hypothetical protein